MTSWTSPSHVVEACIHLTCSLAPLMLVLNAFQYLDDDELSQLVTSSRSCSDPANPYVSSHLLPVHADRQDAVPQSDEHPKHWSPTTLAYF
jgi:hypothetical protein